LSLSSPSRRSNSLSPHPSSITKITIRPFPLTDRRTTGMVFLFPVGTFEMISSPFRVSHREHSDRITIYGFTLPLLCCDERDPGSGALPQTFFFSFFSWETRLQKNVGTPFPSSIGKSRHDGLAPSLFRLDRTDEVGHRMRFKVSLEATRGSSLPSFLTSDYSYHISRPPPLSNSRQARYRRARGITILFFSAALTSAGSFFSSSFPLFFPFCAQVFERAGAPSPMERPFFFFLCYERTCSFWGVGPRFLFSVPFFPSFDRVRRRGSPLLPLLSFTSDQA